MNIEKTNTYVAIQETKNENASKIDLYLQKRVSLSIKNAKVIVI